MSNSIPVQLKCLDERATVPQYKSAGAAAFDLHACLPESVVVLVPGETRKIPTGIALFVKDPGFCLEIWERSGLGSQGIQRRGGLVDADYQGECCVMLTNGTHAPFVVNHGDRVGQAKITPVVHARFELVDEFDVPTERGTNGFGSTGA